MDGMERSGAVRGCLGEEVVVAAARVWREEDGIEEKEGGGEGFGRVLTKSLELFPACAPVPVSPSGGMIADGCRRRFGRSDCRRVQEGAEVQESRLDR